MIKNNYLILFSKITKNNCFSQVAPMMSFSYRAKLSKKLNKCTYRPIWSEFSDDSKLELKFIFDKNLFLIKKTFFSMLRHANINFI